MGTVKRLTKFGSRVAVMARDVTQNQIICYSTD
jgi:hypothetical protein